MHTRFKGVRAAVFCTIAFIFSLSACGGKTAGSVVTPKASQAPTQAPMTAAERFTFDAKAALLDAVTKSEKLESLQLGLLLNPGAQAADTQSNYTKSTVSLSDPADPGNDLTLSLEACLDTASGAASVVNSIQAGQETAVNSGVYFTGSTMLLKRGSADLPMVQHTLVPAVAESYHGISALERFMRIMSGETEPKLTSADWDTAIGAYLESVASLARESDYVSQPQEITMAGVTQTGTATVLTLSGENAATAVRGLIGLISKDSIFKSLFISQYLVGEDTFGVTGLDGVARDLDAMTPEEISALSLSFKVLGGEKLSGLYLAAATGAKNMSILLKFYEDGNVRENNLGFSGFDGSSVKLLETNAASGNDQYSGQITFDDTAPGGILQEHAELTSSSTITATSLQSSGQFKYTRAATFELPAMEAGGTVEYAQQTGAQGTSGQASGTVALVQEGETSNLNFAMTLEQADTAPAVSVPQFIPEAGLSCSDQAGLFLAINDSVDPAQFMLAPVTVRTLSALLMILN